VSILTNGSPRPCRADFTRQSERVLVSYKSSFILFLDKIFGERAVEENRVVGLVYIQDRINGLCYCFRLYLQSVGALMMDLEVVDGSLKFENLSSSRTTRHTSLTFQSVTNHSLPNELIILAKCYREGLWYPSVTSRNPDDAYNF